MPNAVVLYEAASYTLEKSVFQRALRFNCGVCNDLITCQYHYI